MREIKEVYVSTTDRFINVVTPGMLYRYEGLALCPEHLKRWMKAHPDKVKSVSTAYQFDD